MQEHPLISILHNITLSQQSLLGNIKMLIIAHRGNYKGVCPTKENSVEALRFCLERGWGIEIDIRRTPNGEYYISHDPSILNKNNHADVYCHLFRQYPDRIIALNLKEFGYEIELIEYLNKNNITSQVFLFDMELIEPEFGQTAKLLRQLDAEIKIAARVSDRNEPIERALSIESASIIWLDEFDNLWLTNDDIQKIKEARKVIYAISPEIHGFSMGQVYQRWEQFYTWGVNGICTDHADELELTIKSWLG